jgi:hypothetical protein
VRPCLYAADDFVMTSQWEGLPRMLIEPIEDDLIEAMLLMSRNTALTQAKADDARTTILSTYSLEDSVDKLIHIYRKDHGR